MSASGLMHTLIFRADYQAVHPSDAEQKSPTRDLNVVGIMLLKIML
jgi:hypothetical protein